MVGASLTGIGAFTAPTHLLGYLTFLAALILTLILAMAGERGRRYSIPSKVVHGILLLISPAILLLLPWVREIPHLRSLLGVLFLLTSLYGLTSLLRPRSVVLSVAMSFVLSSLLLTLMYGSGFPEPVLVLEVLSIISSAVGFVLLRSMEDERLEVDGYSLLLIPASLLLLSELTLVFNFLPYFITYDPTLHQYWARMLADNHHAYTEWYYVGYHSILAFAYELGESTPLELVTTSWSLNLITLLLVHKAFSKLKGREFSFAAWFTFSGLSWVAWLRYGANIGALEEVERATYRSLTWGFPQFLWGFPLTLSIGILALLIYLHEEQDSPEFLLFITLLLLFLLHVVEAVLFSMYVLFRSIGGKRVPISTVAVPLTAIILHIAWGTSRGTILSSLAMLSLSLSALIASRFGFRIRVSERWPSLRPVLMSLYLSGIAIWVYRMDSLDTYRIHQLGQFPWILYPVLLGVPGLLVLSSDLREGRAFLVLALSSIVMGRLITIYKLWVGYIPYWEYRFFLYVFLGVSAAVGYQLTRMRGRKGVFLLVILLSVLSTPLSAARWGQMAATAANVLSQGDVSFMTGANVSEPLLLFSQNSVWVAAYGPPVRWVRSVPPWVASGPEVVMASLGNFSREVDVLATIYDEALLWGMNASRSYMRGYWRESPSIFHLRTSCIDPDSPVAVILPSDTYLRERALDAYRLVGDVLPPHTTYLRDDPLAPPGIYLGSPAPVIKLDERLPTDPKDPRWIYVRGPFLTGLRVVGDEGLAISRFELDEGEFMLVACPEENNGSVAVVFQYENPRKYREAGIDVVRGMVFGTEDDGPVPRASCYRMVLRIGPKGASFVVNGREFPLDGVRGILGLHTVGFFGNLTGRVRGRHWVDGSKEGDVILSVVPGGDVDLSHLLDSYYGRGEVDPETLATVRSAIQEVVTSRRQGRCGLPTGIGSAREVRASGSVLIEGRAIWVKEKEGRRIYSTKERSILKASMAKFRGGLGFYVLLEVEGAELDGTPIPDGSLVMFRTPFLLRAEGLVEIGDYHRMDWFVTGMSDVELKSVEVKVLMGDGAYLFTPSLTGELPSPEPYDELSDLLLALPLVIAMLVGRTVLVRRSTHSGDRLSQRTSR